MAPRRGRTVAGRETAGSRGRGASGPGRGSRHLPRPGSPVPEARPGRETWGIRAAGAAAGTELRSLLRPRSPLRRSPLLGNARGVTAGGSRGRRRVLGAPGRRASRGTVPWPEAAHARRYTRVLLSKHHSSGSERARDLPCCRRARLHLGETPTRGRPRGSRPPENGNKDLAALHPQLRPDSGEGCPELVIAPGTGQRVLPTPPLVFSKTLNNQTKRKAFESQRLGWRGCPVHLPAQHKCLQPEQRLSRLL